MIYFIQSGNDGPIRIGYAAKVGHRIKMLQRRSPIPLRLLAIIDGRRVTQLPDLAVKSRVKVNGVVNGKPIPV